MGFCQIATRPSVSEPAVRPSEIVGMLHELVERDQGGCGAAPRESKRMTETVRSTITTAGTSLLAGATLLILYLLSLCNGSPALFLSRRHRFASFGAHAASLRFGARAALSDRCRALGSGLEAHTDSMNNRKNLRDLIFDLLFLGFEAS